MYLNYFDCTIYSVFCSVLLLTPYFHPSYSFHFGYNPVKKQLFTNTIALASSTQDEQNIYEDLRSKLKGTCVYFIGMMGSGYLI